MFGIADLNRRLTCLVESARPGVVTVCLERLDRAEIRWVERQNRLTRHASLRAAAMWVSRSGNGWLYLGLAIALLPAGTFGALVIAAAAASALVAHAVYPVAKLFVARPRPFASYTTVTAHGTPLDEYSFPSGHCMTATAVFVAIGTAFPLSIPLAVTAVGLLGWARLACAHHYPSDLLCGMILGVVVAVPICHVLIR
jgi:undecaprenyl-diphosphatase